MQKYVSLKLYLQIVILNMYIAHMGENVYERHKDMYTEKLNCI